MGTAEIAISAKMCERILINITLMPLTFEVEVHSFLQKHPIV